ncbi:MAG: hypothetical protein N3C61_03190 [Candidatus Micrarchaeota archaeon]|nr:hypothetical protein [Candidatus Micrarchaeota archaeon]
MVYKAYLLGFLLAFSGCIDFLFPAERPSDLLRDANKQLSCNTKVKLKLSNSSSNNFEQLMSEMTVDVTTKWNLDRAYMKFDTSILMIPISLEITERSSGELEMYVTSLTERVRLNESEAQNARQNFIRNIFNTISIYEMIRSLIQESNTMNDLSNKLKNKFLDAKNYIPEATEDMIRVERHECKIENTR